VGLTPNAAEETDMTVHLYPGEINTSSVSVSPTDNEVEVGGQITFEATTVPDGRAVTWTIVDGNAGTIDSDGIFTAVREGTCKVRATSGITPGEVTVTVVPNSAS
jgi:uncharacterized protein YjdB